MVEPDDLIVNPVLYDDVPSKRVAPTYNGDPWLRSETNRALDNTLVNLDRRGGSWMNKGSGSARWSANNKIIPYYLYNKNGINYKSNLNQYGVAQPNAWYGRGWYRVLSRSNPKYRLGRRSMFLGNDDLY